MKYLRCPFCHEDEELEQFPRFFYCHACQAVRPKNVSVRSDLPETLEERLHRRSRWFKNPRLREFSSKRFTDRDYEIVRQALLRVPKYQQRIIVMHFWKNQSLSEISDRTELGREQVLWILNCAYQRLHTLCMKNPEFSRFIVIPNPSAEAPSNSSPHPSPSPFNGPRAS
jgi:hypothetical protein